MASRKAEVIYVGDASSVVRASREAEAAAGKASSGITKSHNGIAGSFAGMARRAAGAAVAVAAAYASIEGAKKATEATEELAHTTLTLSKNFGLSVKTASEWGAQAKARGLDSNKLTVGFKTLSTAIRGANDGSKANVAVFKELGISTDDLKTHGDDLQSMLGRVSDGLQKLPPGTEKAALQAKLFGRSWQTLAPLLRDGSKNMNDQLGLADKYGAVFSGKTVKGVEDLIAAQRRSKLATLGLQVAFGTLLAPALTKLITLLSQGIRVVSVFVAGFRDGTGAGGKFRDAIVKVAHVVGPVVQAMAGAVKVAIGAVIVAFKATETAVSGWINKNKPEIEQFGQAVKNFATDVFDVLKAVLVPAFEFVLQVAQRVWPGIKQILQGTLEVINGIVKVFTGVFTGDWKKVWQGVENIFSGGAKAILGELRAVTAPLRTIAADAGGAIASGLKSAFGAVVGVMKSIAAIPINIIKGIYNTLYDLGKFVIKGFIQGIEALAGAVLDTVKNVITAPIDLAKSVLHIGSPSRVFFDIGKNVMEGFINGVATLKSGVTSAISNNLLYPLDAAIAKLNDKKASLQASFDAIDAAAQRSSLLSAISAAGGSGSGSSSGGSSKGSRPVAAAFKPHGGSTGFFPAAGTNYSVGQEPQLAARLDALAKALGLHLTGLSGYRTPAHSVAVGGFANDPHTQAKASDTPGVEGVAEKILLKYGLTRPFGGAKEADHIQLAAGGASAVVAKVRSALKGGTGSKLLTSGQKGYGAELAAQTGLNPQFIAAWLLSEESGSAAGSFAKGGSNNWLNIGPGRKYKTTKEGADAAARLLKTSSAYSGILGAKSVGGQIAALVASPWDAGHYRGGGGLRQLVGEVGSSPFGGAIAKATGKGGGAASSASSVAQAVAALKDFDVQAKRAAVLAKIDLKIKNLTQLKAFKDAIAGIKSQVKDLGSQAAQAWRTIQEGKINASHDATIKAIGNSADAQELAGLQAVDTQEQTANTIQSNQDALTQANADYATALAGGDPVAIAAAVKSQQDAQQAITDFARTQREQKLQDDIDAATKAADDSQQTALNGLDAQTQDYQNALDAQLGALTTSLAQRTISYAQWAKDVDAILKPYGLSASTDPTTEGSVQAGPGPLGAPATGKFKISDHFWKPVGKRASGGPVSAGRPYVVGERGQEVFVPGQSGTIIPHGGRGGGGGPMMHIEKAYFTGARAAKATVDRLAYKAAIGVA